jgi:hypothetical protein
LRNKKKILICTQKEKNYHCAKMEETGNKRARIDDSSKEERAQTNETLKENYMPGACCPSKRSTDCPLERSILVLYYNDLGNAPHDGAYLVPTSQFTAADHALFKAFDYCIMANAENHELQNQAREIAALLEVVPQGLPPASPDNEEEKKNVATKRTFSAYKLSENKRLSGFLVESIYTIYGSC